MLVEARPEVVKVAEMFEGQPEGVRRIDAVNIGAFERMTTEAVESGQDGLRIDFTGVDWAAAYVFRDLMRKRRKCEVRGSGVTLVNAPDSLKHVLEMTGRSGFFVLEN